MAITKSNIPPKAQKLPPGVYTPVISLYKPTKTQELDLDAMYKHAQYLVRGGMHGLVYQGTNGEAVLLTREERIQALKTARRAVTDLGVPEYPIVAGISAESTNTSIELAKDAAEAGASFALLLPPSYWTKAISEEALHKFFRDVADESPLPLVLYNFPQVTPGQDLTSDDLIALAQHPNIVATKLTCANVGKAIRVTSKFTPEQFTVFGGSSDFLFPTLEAGGSGCVAALGNVFPKSTSKLYDLWVAGEKEQARALQDVVANAEWACKKGVVLTKFGAGHFVGPKIGVKAEAFHPRRPYLPPAEKAQKWTVDIMGVLLDEEEKIPDKTFGVNGAK
ncbi:dihydrodipicolinate synthase [Aaosphaeria arxii CBS 175.79]|uniref:Dihydrodipicolinate synthase n=1 Tax=Aaosphaeria arxii CBS 175.79 TaxID=1450172 RepID=A0A6A5XX03_9PLEO|nr:dihydrodipicolinate synthase [Aaosphaeria arxii CBS 175.79]KAF2017489.1 dihydrodipicolinate synthase [Aaosphaeria arxii CBS 175.79]